MSAKTDICFLTKSFPQDGGDWGEGVGEWICDLKVTTKMGRESEGVTMVNEGH